MGCLFEPNRQSKAGCSKCKTCLIIIRLRWKIINFYWSCLFLLLCWHLNFQLLVFKAMTGSNYNALSTVLLKWITMAIKVARMLLISTLWLIAVVYWRILIWIEIPLEFSITKKPFHAQPGQTEMMASYICNPKADTVARVSLFQMM